MIQPALPVCVSFYIAMGHIFSTTFSKCHPSDLCFSQQVYIRAFGKNGCSIESGLQKELFIWVVGPGCCNRPSEGVQRQRPIFTSVHWQHVCQLSKAHSAVACELALDVKEHIDALRKALTLL